MAKSRTEPAGWTNPEVRFERSDVSTGSIVAVALTMCGGLVAIVVGVIWYGQRLQADEDALKRFDLPPARVDETRLPPEPRLEAIDDLKPPQYGGKPPLSPGLFPPRADEYLKPQRDQLEYGDGKAMLKIDDAIDALGKGKLKSRPGGEGTPAEMPSETNSGRSMGGR